MKKGLLPLKALIGLVLGIGMTLLVLFVLFKLIGIFIPGEETTGTPITVFEKINELGNGETTIINFNLGSGTIIFGFPESVNELKLGRMPMVILVQKAPVGDPYPVIRDKVLVSYVDKVNKPLICENEACVCGCKPNFPPEKIEFFTKIDEICKENTLKCQKLDDVENFKSKSFISESSVYNFNSNGIIVQNEEVNPENHFVMLNDPTGEMEKIVLIIRKESKNIFIS